MRCFFIEDLREWRSVFLDVAEDFREFFSVVFDELADGGIVDVDEVEVCEIVWRERCIYGCAGEGAWWIERCGSGVYRLAGSGSDVADGVYGDDRYGTGV